VRSPCLSCELLHEDKNNPTCLNCIRRIRVCEIIDMTEHTIREEKMEPENEEKKICRVCGKLLPLSAYNSNKQCRDGHEGTCKKCRYQKTRAKILLDSLNETQKEPVKQDEPKPFPLSGPPVKIIIPPGTESKLMTLPDNVFEITLAPAEPVIPEPEAERGPKELAGKTNWAVFPFKEASSVVAVFEYGVQKYGKPFSFRAGIPTYELLGAIFRHAIEIQDGQNIDNESGCLHIAHIAANALMMLSQKS